ncbi:hypothetical protein V8F06_011689 [Rhypophila decipiens]
MTTTTDPVPSGHLQPPASTTTEPVSAIPPGHGNDTTSTSDTTNSKPSSLPGLPRLNYNLWDYKIKLSIVTFLLVLESSLIPLALFYGLWFRTTLRHGIIFAIITAFFGLVTGIEFGLRSLKLILPPDTYRPIGGKRWKADFTHWTLSFGYTVMTGILIGASIPHEPLVRPLAIPVPLFMIQMGLMLIATGYMNVKHKPTWCRMSSVPKGERTRPLVYTIVEDIIAVDGAAGLEYRRAFMARYEVSKLFRKMIAKQNWFWGWGSLLVGIGTMVVIWTVQQEIAYGIGWGVPLVWTIIWIVVTVVWVRRDLRHEKEQWARDAMSSVSNINIGEQNGVAAAI